MKPPIRLEARNTPGGNPEDDEAEDEGGEGGKGTWGKRRGDGVKRVGVRVIVRMCVD